MGPNKIWHLERPRNLDTIFRFASFEADRDRYLLRCRNRRLKLERIPLELLFLLLENQGRIVSREQIVSRLWGSEHFLDTERSINTAVRKIRRTLKDDPHQPRFIETVVGKGYRFVAACVSSAEHHEPQPIAPPTGSHPGSAAQEEAVTMSKFLIERNGERTSISCEVATRGVSLGRVQLAELHLPADISLPLKPADKLLLKLMTVRVDVTASAAQTLHALCVSLLQNGTPIQQNQPAYSESVLREAVAVDEVREAGYQPAAKAASASI